MSLGHRVYDELRRRNISSRLLYADIQALKAVPDVAGMRALLAAHGFEAGPERTEPLHFADWIEIQLLRRTLTHARAGLLLFGFS